MTNAMITQNSNIITTYDEVERVAKAMAASGFFPDAHSISQAIVKIMAGSEIGFGPFASMQGVNIIKGKPSYNANMLASSVKASPKYDYRIVTLTDERCDLAFFENGQEVGHSIFTIEDARRAGVSNLDKFPRNMIFARAMSNGVKWYTPDVTNGNAVYTPEELGAEVDEDGNVIDGQVFEIEEPPSPNDQILDELGFEPDEQEPEPEPEPKVKSELNKPRPWDPETLKGVLDHNATLKSNFASDKQRNFLAALLGQYFQDDDKRYTASLWLFGEASTKNIEGAMVRTALDWLKPVQDSGGAYTIDETARKELSQVLTEALKAEGQEALL